MRMVRIFFLVLAALAMAVPAWAGPNTRTLEIEAYQTLTSPDIEVPMVFNGQENVAAGLTMFDVEASRDCIGYEQVQTGHGHETLTGTKDITDKKHGNSHVFGPAPDGTTGVVGEYKYFDWSCWQYKWSAPVALDAAGESGHWKFAGGNKDGYRNVIATYSYEGPAIPIYGDGPNCNAYGPYYCPDVDGIVGQLAENDDDVCIYVSLTDPDDIIYTTTVIVKGITYSKVVTEVYTGETITVRGHIWANNPKPVEYWYVAQTATIPEDYQTVARSDRTAVPDVEGVFATQSWSFTPETPGLYRIFLRILKADGTRGEVRTKVVVVDRKEAN